MSKIFIALALITSLAMVSIAVAENQVATLRGPANLDADSDPQPIPVIVNSDLRKVRNYPEQPPLIPHKIDGYQIDKNVNKCLLCHERRAIEISQAPMVSVTHFMDRDNQVLAQISPRRYFCTQCHVPQHETRLLLKNTFIDAGDLVDFLKNKSGDNQ
jgi:cytochrome c-type protein NapB